VGALSIALAILLPDAWLGLAGWCYFLIGVAQTACGTYYSRKRAARFGAA
jgi:hypothetical protein